jgi:hypothetical protein
LYPLYTSIPFASTDVGYKFQPTFTFTTPTNNTELATSGVLPVGVWLFNLNTTFTGTYNSSMIYLSPDTFANAVAYFPIVAVSGGTKTASVNGTCVISITTATTYKLFYTGNATSGLTKSSEYTYPIVRLA